jgi:diguanylate cyclase (GGDEF)-like protein
LRKELLVDLFEANQQQVGLNQALILFELFNFPDKTVASGEKLNYLTKLKNLPTELLTVDQLQSMYYFSGSIKSSIESSFMESVSDFQQSNYYTYKYWNWIRSINHYLLEKLPSDEYLKVMPRMEGKTIELVNLINIQSNAYVETLQSNFNKINELYLKVEEMSLRDTLTSLYNRRFLYNNINELLLLAVRQQSPLSFVMIDIDDFKPINDTYGHLAGDFILTQMSEMLRNFFRKSDFIVRYGGEEFLIVMFNSDHVQSEQALDTLRRTVMGYNFQYNNVTLHVTISIGIASCIFKSAVATVNLEKLISEADDALYVSKNSGKNKITSTVITY